MDADALVIAHSQEWQRLDALSRKHRLDDAECEEMLDLYQRTTTHLSLIRSTSADPALTQYLSTVLNRARVRSSRDFRADPGSLARFFVETFPAALYRAWKWWAAVGVVSVAVAFFIGWWTQSHPEFVSNVLSPQQIDTLTQHEFEDYYSTYAAQDFAFQVWTNNAWLSALCIAFGALGFPVPWLLWQNMVNVGVSGGLMASQDRLGLFFGLILPHGMLEMTCLFVAGGVGLQAFWSLIEPGARSRGDAFASAMRTAFTVAMGLVVVLLVCGIIEAFVTPSGLPAAVRIGIGLVAWSSFIAYVAILGRRAADVGVSGDVDERLLEDAAVTR